MIYRLFKSIVDSSRQEPDLDPLFRDFVALADLPWMESLPATTSKQVREWLTDKDSLTMRMRSCCQAFSVQSLTSGWHLCQTKSEMMAMRQVLLHGDGDAWLWALTCIPFASLQQAPLLLHLDNKPLGQILFTDKSASQRNFQFADFSVSVPFCQMLPRWHVSNRDPLWGRISQIHALNCEIVLTEVFLPKHPMYGV